MKSIPHYITRHLKSYWQTNLWNRISLVLAALVILLVGTMYGIGQWYIISQENKPLTLGVSFIPDYAQSLGVNPKNTMDALIGIGVKHFRLVSYWSDIEQNKGTYNFSQLDWEFAKADAAHATVSLSIGLRQPRWPECHMPAWADNEPVSVWQPQLETFMKAVINRYKDNPALSSYQLENEYFLKGFGTCTNFSRSRLVSEFNMVKRTDPNHKVIISRSNNSLGIAVNAPTPDEYGISVYKRVWDANITHRYLEYPWPSWYYAFLAGWQKLYNGRDTIIHEMQAEAWPPHGNPITATSLHEQNKSLDATRLSHRFSFAEGTGMREIYMWGAEYWYYRLIILHDPSLWNVAKQEFASTK